MITLPAPYPDALASAFGWTTRLTIEGAELSVPVFSGKLTVDGDAAVTRSLSADVAGADAGQPLAQDVFDALWEYGGWVRAEVVLTVPGADPCAVPMGRFQAQAVKWERTDGALQMDCLGLTSLVDDDRFGTPRTLAAGGGLARLTTLIGESVAGASVVLGVGIADKSLPEATYDESRLDAARDTALALGGFLFERGDGVFEVRTTLPNIGRLDGLVTKRAYAYDRKKTWNAVRAQGTNDDYPGVEAWAYDNDPTSPTRWAGPFGKRPRFYASPVLTTTQQAQDAANTLLPRYLGREYTLALEAVPHPGLEPGDVVESDFEGEITTHQIIALDWPLGVDGAMTIRTTDARTGTGKKVVQ